MTDYLKKYLGAAPRKNPAPRIGTAKPKRPSQATGKAPSKRLVSRRKNNTVKGTFPNKIKPARKTEYKVQVKAVNKTDDWWQTCATFYNKADAIQYGNARAKLYPKLTFRVYW